MPRIARFRTRRGRPRSSVNSGIDYGTPELVAKRQRQQTAELVDILREQGVISAEQHWCALHFRWLYTLRHGCPSVKALDLLEHQSGLPVGQDGAWRQKREEEYRAAAAHLSEAGVLEAVVQGAVFHALRPVQIHGHPLLEGLEMLCRWWKRR